MARNEDINLRISGQDLSEEAIRNVNRQLQELTQQLEEAERQSNSFSGGIGKAKAALGALAGIVAVDAIADFTGNTLEAAEETLLWSERLGLAVENLSALERAMAKYNVEADDVRDGLQTLAERIVEFKDGTGEGLEAFEKLGISALDSVGKMKTVDVVLGELADAFARTTDENTKLFASLILFGDEAGKKLINPLNEGREALEALTKAAKENGAVLTREQAEAARDARLALKDMNAAVSDLGNDLAIAFAPAIAGVSEKLSELIRNTRDTIEALATLNKSTPDFARPSEDIGKLEQAIAELEQRIGANNQKLREMKDAGIDSGRTFDLMRETTDRLNGILEQQRQKLDQVRQAQADAAKAAAEQANQTNNLANASENAREAWAKYLVDFAELKKLYDSGRISVETYNAVLDGLIRTRERLISQGQPLSAELKNVNEQMKKFGIESQTSLESTKESLRTLLELAINNGAAIEDQRAIFAKYAEAVRAYDQFASESEKKRSEAYLQETAQALGLVDIQEERKKKIEEITAAVEADNKARAERNREIAREATLQQEAANAAAAQADAAKRLAKEAERRAYSEELAAMQVLLITRAFREAQEVTAQLTAGIEGTGRALSGNVDFYDQLIQRAETLIERNKTSDDIQTKFGGQTLDKLRAALDDVKAKVQAINDETAEATQKFEELTRQFQESIAARRAEQEGRSEEFRAEQRFKENLRRIEEEAAFSRQQRDELRRLAEQDHQDELRRIAERKRAEQQGNQNGSGPTTSDRSSSRRGATADAGASPFAGARNLGQITLSLPDGDQVDLFGDLREAEKVTKTLRSAQRNTLGGA